MKFKKLTVSNIRRRRCAALFLIDANGIVRHRVVNDLPLGRNIDEMLRMVDALQFHEEHGDVCPAQWEKGKEGMNASPDGVAKYRLRTFPACKSVH